MEITDVVDLRLREELLPREAEGIVDEAPDLERPGVEGDVRHLAEVEDGPVLDLMLTDRQLGQAVPIEGTAALGREADELDVDGALIELNLALDVLEAACDEVVPSHPNIVGRTAGRTTWQGVAPQWMWLAAEAQRATCRAAVRSPRQSSPSGRWRLLA